MQPAPTTVKDNEEPFEPCPTPLAWQDVVNKCAEDSSRFEVSVGGETVTGWTIGTGDPLYFVNGLLGSSQLYSLTAWLMRENFQCVLFDLPGSFAPGTNGENYGRGLAAIAEQLGHSRYSLFTTGAGCVAAFDRLFSKPESIERVVLQGGFAKCRLSFAERVVASIGSFCPGRVRSIPGALNILRQNHRPWFPPYDHSRWAFAETLLGDSSMKGLARRAKLIPSFDIRPRLSELHTPTLLVRCEGDSPIQVEAQDLLEKSIPGVAVEWLHTCGRLPFLTHPHRLKKILNNFLGS